MMIDEIIKSIYSKGCNLYLYIRACTIMRKGHENGVPQVWKLDEMLRLQWSSEKFYARGDFGTKPNPSTWLLLNFGFGIQ